MSWLASLASGAPLPNCPRVHTIRELSHASDSADSARLRQNTTILWVPVSPVAADTGEGLRGGLSAGNDRPFDVQFRVPRTGAAPRIILGGGL